MYSGGRTLADFWENWKTRVFRFWEKSEKVGPTSRPRFGAFQIAVSRARAVKNILAGPDGSGAPPEPSGPARIFFMARARETVIWNALRAWWKPAEKYEKTGPPNTTKNQKMQEIHPRGLRFWAWGASFGVFRWVKRGPHVPKLLWHVCFPSENTKRPVCSVPGADRTKLPFAPLRKSFAHTSPGQQSWAQIIQQNRARPAGLERCAPKVSAKVRRATSFYPPQGQRKQVALCSLIKNTRATAILGRADPVSPT